MRLHHEKLKARGWSNEEIADVHAALARAEEQKSRAHAFLEKGVFWLLLLLVITTTFTTSLLLLPLLLTFADDLTIALIGALLGLCTGTLFAILIPDIEWLEGHHHAFALLLLTAVALANTYFITLVAKPFEALLHTPVHSPWLLSLLYAGALVTPYIVHLIAAPKHLKRPQRHESKA